MKNADPSTYTQVEIANLFTTHPNIDLGPEQGLHDLDGRLLADFQGSFELGEYDHQVSYNFVLEEHLQLLEISQTIEIGDCYLLIEYQGGTELVSVTDTEKNVRLIADYQGSRLMKTSIEYDNQHFIVQRDLEHAQGVAPVFKVSID